MNEHNQAILDEFTQHKPGFEKMCQYILNDINSRLAENRMEVTTVAGRVKTYDSLAGKLELKGYKYKSLKDITDIIGLRIIVLLPEDVDKIASLIEQKFTIDWENSVDKRKSLESDQFGYLSLHYICSIPKSSYVDEDDPDINDYKIEIQMRTTLQHAWAQINHDIGYKSAIEIPKEYSRKFSRLAGLLEIADDEFSNIARDIANYRRRVGSLVKSGNFAELSLDRDSFDGYIAIKPFKELNTEIAGINKAEIEKQRFDNYYAVFVNFGFKTIQDIADMINQYKESAYRLAALQITGTDLDILAETIGVQNLCVVKILCEGGGAEGVENFLNIIRGKNNRNRRIAENYVAKATTLGLIKE